jgi:hypothetical protein
MPSPGERGKYGENESKSETPGRAAFFFTSARPVTVVLTPQILLRMGGSCMTSSDDIHEKHEPKEPVTTYHEKKITGTLYRVTSVYKGEVELGKALEDLTVKKIMSLENPPPQFIGSHL